MCEASPDKGPKPYHQATPRAISNGLLPGQWREPKYPGDAALNLDVMKGDEMGMVRVQVYGPDSYMVASYLPGRIVDNPGDTPKVEPERATWCETRADASKYFAGSVVNAFRDGWRPARAGFEQLIEARTGG